MAALWEFVSGAAEIDDSELPAAEDLREQSPEAMSFWGSLCDFVTGSASVTEAELPAANVRADADGTDAITPARETKRGREAAANPDLKDFEAKLQSSTGKDVTRDDLVQYLTEKGEQVPPNAKKDKLLSLARTASEAKAAPAAAADDASDEKPTLSWPIVRLRRLAEAKGIAIQAGALKHEIFDEIVDAMSPARQAAKKASPTRKSTASDASPARKSTASDASPSRKSTTKAASPSRKSSTKAASPARKSSTKAASPSRKSSTAKASPARKASAGKASPSRKSSTASPSRKSSTPARKSSSKRK